MYEYYQDYVNHSIKHNANTELISYQQFLELYETQSYGSVCDYVTYLKATINGYSNVSIAHRSGSSSGSSGDN